MSFREEAIAAYEQRRQGQETAEAERQQEQADRIRAEFLLDFGLEPDQVIDQGSKVVIDGITLFPRYQEHLRFWHVVGMCPRCGEVCHSDRCRTLADIGAQVVAFVPNWPHHCQVLGPEEETSPERQIVGWLRAMIAEELAEASDE